MSEINGTENARRLDHPQCVHGAARCNKAAQIRERALAARSARGTPECGPTTPAASLLANWNWRNAGTGSLNHTLSQLTKRFLICATR